MGPRHLVWPFGTVRPVVREPAHRALKIAGGQISTGLDPGKSLPIPEHASGDPRKRNPAIPTFGLDGHRIKVRDMKQFVSERHHAGDISREISRLSREDGIFPVRNTPSISGKFPKMGTLAARIQRRIDDLKLKPAVVARVAGFKPDYVRDILRGSKKTVSTDGAIALARALQCNLNWLVTGEEPIAPEPNRRMIQVVGYVGAGAEIFATDDHMKGAGLEEIECPMDGLASSTVAVRVRGDSMAPAYFDGDLIYYETTHADFRHLLGKECVVAMADGRRFVKQLRRTQSGQWYLHSYNAEPILDATIEWAAKVKLIQRSE